MMVRFFKRSVKCRCPVCHAIRFEKWRTVEKYKHIWEKGVGHFIAAPCPEHIAAARELLYKQKAPAPKEHPMRTLLEYGRTARQKGHGETAMEVFLEIIATRIVEEYEKEAPP